MNLAGLSQAGRAPALPLSIELADAAGPAELTLQRLLRVLPGQRYVAQAEWRGQPVLAKLLVGNKAARHFQRERDGVHLLAEQGLNTPQLLADGLREDEGGWLLFEYLDGAQSLWEAWRAVENQPLLNADQQAVLADALVSIAQMHAKGLWQADLHLDNLLRHNGQLFVIDGGGVQVEVAGQPLSRGRVLENLGVFFAQLPAELTPFIEELLVHYLLSNGEHALPLEALLKEVEKIRKWRLRDYLRKIARDCSLFAAKIGAFGLQVVRRDSQAELQPLLNNLDLLTEQGHIYKTGGAATVAQVQLQGRPLVVKRYNVKSVAHWLKRFWRPSRAWHSWVEANRLQLLGIATPQPLAVLERRWCWLRGRAYLITEYCGGQDIIARFQAFHDGSPPETDLLALDSLFAALLRERISHGDFKGHNLFWDERLGRWSLIDLDAMQQHRSARSFAKAYARDRARFLRNWPADSALHQLLNQRIPLTPAVGSAD
ncbi:MAG: lipopolysaccharide kinase InaA family protein [Pseudomonas sp.]|uniref:lipopolysaccharide kinase InaA family protein n=1 Tax=Pseudomonas sp. TaxID=306 RepID=UPI00272074FE|nr:lipopolysaccharide kinase InaA family protein [Pseudomonas sp.]MDO9616630.1 lipopolysaccharide kinase InaA family protein [Pseudomonas sp.]MDP2447605.1 lipopolysaccharide kinase InaA family protein [Pseudomonas sp.]MDZ4335435.1 lipopolysaccharide kinase InaA family protein [Pseudomonas sp.]